MAGITPVSLPWLGPIHSSRASVVYCPVQPGSCQEASRKNQCQHLVWTGAAGSQDETIFLLCCPIKVNQEDNDVLLVCLFVCLISCFVFLKCRLESSRSIAICCVQENNNMDNLQQSTSLLADNNFATMRMMLKSYQSLLI